jgi:hypothetical protein
MQKSQSDLKILKLIADIKWQKGFKCRKCSHKEAYINKVNYSRKCTKCDSIESATVNTAFAGLRLSLSLVIKLFIALQENYIEWFTYVQENPDEFYRDKIRHFPPRLSFKSVSKKLEVRPEAAWYFIKRITEWLPRKYWKESYGGSHWSHFKQKENKMYDALFNLLFSDEYDKEYDRHFSARDWEDCITLLVSRKLPKREE